MACLVGAVDCEPSGWCLVAASSAKNERAAAAFKAAGKLSTKAEQQRDNSREELEALHGLLAVPAD